MGLVYFFLGAAVSSAASGLYSKDYKNSMMNYATGTSVLYPTLREGCVFRNYDNSISFKAVSNEFLLKWDNK